MRMAYDYHGDDPCVVTGRCHKADVLAYFLRRKEFEILIDPQRVEVLSEPENERLPERGGSCTAGSRRVTRRMQANHSWGPIPERRWPAVPRYGHRRPAVVSW
jgi:hypothetical protein